MGQSKDFIIQHNPTQFTTEDRPSFLLIQPALLEKWIATKNITIPIRNNNESLLNAIQRNIGYFFLSTLWIKLKPKLFTLHYLKTKDFFLVILNTFYRTTNTLSNTYSRWKKTLVSYRTRLGLATALRFGLRRGSGGCGRGTRRTCVTARAVWGGRLFWSIAWLEINA